MDAPPQGESVGTRKSTGPVAESIKRVLLVVHRYLGISLCLIMVMWCGSGFVMMYVNFPRLSDEERVASLAPLNFSDCCNFAAARETLGTTAIDAFAIEMLGDRPVLRVRRGSVRSTIDLRRGTVSTPIDGKEAIRIGRDYQRATGVSGRPRFLGTIDHDQWTVSGEYANDRPLQKVALGDSAGTEIYVAAETGQLVQRTTAQQRTWNYVGAVTHWLYFTPLRIHGALWAQTIIWLAVLGLCLTVAGFAFGVLQLRIGPAPTRWIPYRGARLWHHVCGILFGLATITWVASGLLSMNPWGLLESSYGAGESLRLRGVELTPTQAVDDAERLAQRANSGDAAPLRQLASAPLGDAAWLVATRQSGRTRLSEATLSPVPLTAAELLKAARALQPDRATRGVERPIFGDDYYYPKREGAFVPPYRVIFNDPAQSRYYFDPVSGALLTKFDGAARSYRWLFEAAHRWDFSPGLRRRPLWNFLVGFLLLGVTVSSLTGVVLGCRRVLREQPLSVGH